MQLQTSHQSRSTPAPDNQQVDSHPEIRRSPRKHKGQGSLSKQPIEAIVRQYPKTELFV